MAARLSRLLHGVRIAIQFWWLNLRVDQLRKTILKRSKKK
jgi:hypothetical protein